MHPCTRQLVLGLALAGFLLASADEVGIAPQAPPPRTPSDYPAHDAHEGVTIAAVPIPDAPQAVAVFGATAAPVRAGFLPVELILSNQRAEMVRVDLDRIQLVTADDKFEQAEPEEIAWALYPPPDVKEPRPRAPRYPIPIPQGKKGDKNRSKREEAEATLRARRLRAGVVAPGASARGYLYFDLRDATLDLTHARLYIPTVVVLPSHEPLFYFEIVLKPYAKP